MNPTQVKYPWRAALRTVLAYVVAAGIVEPVVWAIAQDTLGPYLSPQVITAVAWAVGLIVAVSAFVTRVIAIPQVNAWLTKLGVGATPATVAQAETEPDPDEPDPEPEDEYAPEETEGLA